jgi:hypothetical protein
MDDISRESCAGYFDACMLVAFVVIVGRLHQLTVKSSNINPLLRLRLCELRQHAQNAFFPVNHSSPIILYVTLQPQSALVTTHGTIIFVQVTVLRHDPALRRAERGRSLLMAQTVSLGMASLRLSAVASNLLRGERIIALRCRQGWLSSCLLGMWPRRSSDGIQFFGDHLW